MKLRSMFLALAATFMTAQDAMPRLAMFVPQQVLNSTTRGKKLLGEYTSVEKNWEDKLQAKSAEGQALQKQLQSSTLDEVAKEKITRQLRDLEFDFKKMQEDAQAEVGKAQQKVQTQFNNEVTPLVEALAKERKLQMIINYQQGLYTIFDAAWGLDFTNEIAKRYDAAAAPAKSSVKAPEKK